MKPSLGLNPGPNPAQHRSLGLSLLGLQAGEGTGRHQARQGRARSTEQVSEERPERRKPEAQKPKDTSGCRPGQSVRVDVDLPCLRRSGWGLLLYGHPRPLLPSLQRDLAVQGKPGPAPRWVMPPPALPCPALPAALPSLPLLGTNTSGKRSAWGRSQKGCWSR